ncbi:hypothetical protein WJX79_008768 [Trebouxia sp. C0005]
MDGFHTCSCSPLRWSPSSLRRSRQAQERICFWRLPTISRPPMGLRNFSNQMQLLAKMIIAGTCARGFWLSSLSVKQSIQAGQAAMVVRLV